MLKYKNLIGRQWIPESQHCFSLTRDFFNQNFSINLPNFSIPMDWDADKLDLIRLLRPKTGFEMLPIESWNELRPADVLATCRGSSNPNHLVIVLEGNQLLHHSFGKLSGVETMRPAWKMITGYILRHPDVPDLTPVLPDTTIEELLRANYQI